MRFNRACCPSRLFLLVLVLVLSAWAAWAVNVRVKVFHIPPGNPVNFHTINISENAVAAHLAHGEAATCPCTALFDFIDLLALGPSCVDLGNGGVAVSGVPEYDSRYSASSDGPDNPSPLCGWSAMLPGQFDSPEYLSIAPQQAAACVQIIRDAIASHGLTCSPRGGPPPYDKS